MSHQAKLQYLMAIYDRYHESSKKEKGRILDEFCAARLKEAIPEWLPF